MDTKTAAREYYDRQAALAKAVSDLNAGSLLDPKVHSPWNRKDAEMQVTAINEFIARREAEIEALKDALLFVESGNLVGKLDAYLEDRGLVAAANVKA